MASLLAHSLDYGHRCTSSKFILNITLYVSRLNFLINVMRGCTYPAFIFIVLSASSPGKCCCFVLPSVHGVVDCYRLRKSPKPHVCFMFSCFANEMQPCLEIRQYRLVSNDTWHGHVGYRFISVLL